MIRRKYRFFTQLTLVCDLLVVAGSYFAAYEALASWRHWSLPPLRNYLWVLAMIGPFWIIALWRSGLYDPRTYRTPGTIVRALLKAQLIGGGMLLSAMFLTKSEEVSRLLLQIFFVVSGMALAVERFAAVGYSVVQGRSDWVFGPDDGAIQDAILAGWAMAARDLGDVPLDRIAAWFTHRRELIADRRARLQIGHIDVFASPTGRR